MKCLNPRVIPTRSKILAPQFGEKLKREVRCGRCANCQQTFQREWYFRAFYEYKSTVNRGGFMLMDCLTYSNKCVPRLSRFYPDLPKELDFMCFDYFDLRYFLVELRDYLGRKGYDVKDNLRYFAATEYGTEKFKTHRPHIHLLFYCTVPNLTNYTLSCAIAHCWRFGRTDGIPYKTYRYVDEYTISSGLASAQRASKYVSKYVMKSSYYQRVIDIRVNKLLYYYYENKFRYYVQGDWNFDSIDYAYREPKERVDWHSFESFLKSTTAKKLKSSLLRYMNQFHRQSLGFGASALNEIDVDTVIASNVVAIPDGQSIVMRLGLPNYFRRKLFYHLVEVNGLKSWVLNDDPAALRYKKKRDEDKLKMLIDEFSIDKRELRLEFDETKLAEYVINDRFTDVQRIFLDELNILEKLQLPFVLYNYSTISDIAKFHLPFVTDTFLGSSASNYVYNDKPSKVISAESFFDYLRTNTYEDSDYENLLSLIKKKKRPLHQSMQKNFSNKQRLMQIYKDLKNQSRVRV